VRAMVDEGTARPSSSSRGPRGRRSFLPFWVLQGTELLVAVIFVDISVHVSRGGVLIGGALAYGALAVTANGPLGIFRLVSRTMHVRLAIVVSALLAVSPIISALRPDIEGIIVMEFGAIGVIRLATFTVTDGPGLRSGGRAGRPVIDSTATIGKPVPPLSSVVSTEKQPAARWLGRTTATAAASGKRVADKHRPEAEAQVKRTIRGAGRLAGRLSSSSKRDPEP
jgi:hypothetical protein